MYHRSNLVGFMYKRQLLNVCTNLDLCTIFRLNLCTVLPTNDDTAVPETYFVCLLTLIFPCNFKGIESLSQNQIF